MTEQRATPVTIALCEDMKTKNIKSSNLACIVFRRDYDRRRSGAMDKSRWW